MPFGELSRGLNDLAVYPLSGVADTRAAKVDVPGARSLELSTSADSEAIEGDDSILGVAYNAPQGSGSLTAARFSPPAMAAMLGGTATTTGVTPNQITTWNQSGDPNQVHVAIIGQALSVDVAGSAYEVEIHKAKFGGISETLELNTFHIPSLDFSFIKDASGDFISRRVQETRAAVPA